MEGDSILERRMAMDQRLKHAAVVEDAVDAAVREPIAGTTLSEQDPAGVLRHSAVTLLLSRFETDCELVVLLGPDQEWGLHLATNDGQVTVHPTHHAAGTAVPAPAAESHVVSQLASMLRH